MPHTVKGGVTIPSQRHKLRRGFFRAAARFLEARQALLNQDAGIHGIFKSMPCLIGELDQCKEMQYILEEARGSSITF